MDELRHILHLCTGLHHVDCTADATFLNDVVQAAPYVQHIMFSLICLHDDTAYPGEHRRPVLATWLAFGHATHLHLDQFHVRRRRRLGPLHSHHDVAHEPQATGIARVVHGLVDATMPLPNITELCLHSP
ncbi:hypothetical protein SDRG_03965 [Saprolegnia diclina VS20]|uniref:Uncharacterized protein n=1 Tax=Saprolegnia diclina (strain VS20) TaxID=1156394 RepID=T0S286_SAPDV|nr:hypothetical protein SDRG_03965 [Saprolegnia diclina VS20]EQC39013.1 hypothetical protein SDRG_03965 [Saprolegnia diclina VS20]|eukprot:XP_008607837.1 hypothetical protein SDRG_03965 [Saprolegnia diclina VS20]